MGTGVGLDPDVSLHLSGGPSGHRPHPEASLSCWPAGWRRSRLWVSQTVSGSIRMLKLPLPRVEVQPFPPDWPRPARPLPPLLLQPALQRYFLPGDADPDSYS